jgi:hypothetical protein
MTETITRAPAGIPIGGEFTRHQRAEATISLDRVPENDTVLTSLLDAASSSWKENIAGDPATPEALLVALAHSWNPDDRVLAASSSRLPRQTLTELLGDQNGDVRENVAQNPETDAVMIRSLFGTGVDLDYNLESAIARNPNTPTDILNVIAANGFDGHRRDVAGNESAPVDLLVQLSTDRYDYTRETVARRQELPDATVVFLSKDRSSTVRTAVARRHHLDRTVLSKLAHDRDSYVRRAIATRHDLPDDTRAALVKDVDADVRRLASRH